MANFEVLETYNSEIEKLEPTTPGHADVFNAIFQQLINNDAFIKKVAEQQLTIIQSHLNNENEPHQKVFDTYYRQLVNYTDKAIADLINVAPETADTLRELADLIDKNKDVATALNEAIGKKANQTELDQAISDINTLNSGLKKYYTQTEVDNIIKKNKVKSIVIEFEGVTTNESKAFFPKYTYWGYVGEKTTEIDNLIAQGHTILGGFICGGPHNDASMAGNGSDNIGVIVGSATYYNVPYSFYVFSQAYQTIRIKVCILYI